MTDTVRYCGFGRPPWTYQGTSDAVQRSFNSRGAADLSLTKASQLTHMFWVAFHSSILTQQSPSTSLINASRLGVYIFFAHLTYRIFGSTLLTSAVAVLASNERIVERGRRMFLCARCDPGGLVLYHYCLCPSTSNFVCA